MKKSVFAVIWMAIFSIGFFSQAKAEESFSVKKGNIVIVTVGGMQVAFSNDENGDCGTFFIIDPKTGEVTGMGGILDLSSIMIEGDIASMHCVFSAAGSKTNPELESRPLIVKR